MVADSAAHVVVGEPLLLSPLAASANWKAYLLLLLLLRTDLPVKATSSGPCTAPGCSRWQRFARLTAASWWT